MLQNCSSMGNLVKRAVYVELQIHPYKKCTFNGHRKFCMVLDLLNESRNVFCENFNPKEFLRHFTLDVVTLLNASEYLLK